jgi:hypothetical protein
MQMSDPGTLAAEPGESYVVSNVLRCRVPYIPLRLLEKPGVIESNEDVIRNESGRRPQHVSRKVDWEWPFLLAAAGSAAAYKLICFLLG